MSAFLIILCMLNFIVLCEVLRYKKINKIQLLILVLSLIILSKSVTAKRNKEIMGESGNCIELISGELGEYGERVRIDDFEYIWYHLPMGKYKVEAGDNNELSKLYLDKNIISDEPINIKTLSYLDFSEEQVIIIDEGEHIEITKSSRYKLTPIKSD